VSRDFELGTNVSCEEYEANFYSTSMKLQAYISSSVQTRRSYCKRARFRADPRDTSTLPADRTQDSRWSALMRRLIWDAEASADDAGVGDDDGCTCLTCPALRLMTIAYVHSSLPAIANHAPTNIVRSHATASLISRPNALLNHSIKDYNYEFRLHRSNS